MNTHFFPKSLDKPYIGIIHRNRLIRGWKKGKVVEDKKTARSCFFGGCPFPHAFTRALTPVTIGSDEFSRHEWNLYCGRKGWIL